MASKRDLASISSGGNSHDNDGASQPASKRQRSRASSSKARVQQPEQKTDPTYGQRCAFPGLDAAAAAANSDDDLEFEDDQDALAYLRSVRQEASAIPTLLVAPRNGPQRPATGDSDDGPGYHGGDGSIYDDGRGDSRGYYADGAYTAAPDASYNGGGEGGDERRPAGGGRRGDGGHYDEDFYSDAADDADADAAPRDGAARAAAVREAYFASLVARFASLRALLHTDPPIEALMALPKGSQDYEVLPFASSSSSGRDGGGRSHRGGGHSNNTFSVWSARLRRCDPAPAQVAAMDKRGVVRLLRVVLGGKFLRRGAELRERTSRWVWALLARLPARGELDHVEVGVVRDLGKRAVLLLVSLAQAAALRAEVPGLEEGGEEDGEWDDGEWDDAGEEDAGEEDAGEEGAGGGGGGAAAEGEPGPHAPAEGGVGSASGQPTEEEGASGPGRDEDDEMEDGEVEDGEVPDEEATATAADLEAAIAAAKARLLAGVEGIADRPSQAEDAAAAAAEDAAERARINTRATLNMILTVAGEFYGQRDLLEFRDPFAGPS